MLIATLTYHGITPALKRSVMSSSWYRHNRKRGLYSVGDFPLIVK